MSLAGWNGTVVNRPSGWRYCLCDPFCRISINPSLSKMATTSLGLRIGYLPMLCDHHNLCADELCLLGRLAALNEHLDDLLEVPF